MSVSRGGAVLAGVVLALVVSVLSSVPLWASMALCATFFVCGMTLVAVGLWRRRN